MNILAAVAVTVLVLLSQTEAHDDLWLKYGAIKIMNNCLTEKGGFDWRTLVEESLTKCNRRFDSAPHQFTMDSMPGASFDTSLRHSPTFSAAKIMKLKQMMAKKIVIFRCVVQEIGITNRNNEIDVTSIMNLYRAIPLPTGLMRDIEKAVNLCYDYTKCLPLSDKRDLPIPADIVRTKKWIKCEHHLRIAACLKYDLGPLVNEFELEGLDGKFDFLDSDEARALAVLKINDKVGYEDYGLYE